VTQCFWSDHDSRLTPDIRNDLKGNSMRSLLAAGTLFWTSVSAFARDTTILAVPEPGSMFLIGVAGAAVVFAIRKKK
jgi:hypothetical protein